MRSPSRIQIIQSNTYDTCINLAFEEYFMQTVPEGEWILFWWQSDNAVVVGRNQNPYQECNLERLVADQVKLVRRLSGGGAVYHDLGNLNFSFISQTECFDPALHFDMILSGLFQLGVQGIFTGRNDLVAEGRKFSGNAFIHSGERHLHHGTLLIASDVGKIENYLTVHHEKLETKGFDSIKARVINLTEIVPDLTAEDIIESVTHSLRKQIGCEVALKQLDDTDKMLAQAYVDKYYSDIWNLGDTPNFSCEMCHRFDWGSLQLGIEIEDGQIKKIKFSTDALDAESFATLSNEMVNMLLVPDLVYDKIVTSGLVKKTALDVYGLIAQNLFR